MRYEKAQAIDFQPTLARPAWPSLLTSRGGRHPPTDAILTRAALKASRTSRVCDASSEYATLQGRPHYKSCQVVGPELKREPRLRFQQCACFRTLMGRVRRRRREEERGEREGTLRATFDASVPRCLNRESRISLRGITSTANVSPS